MPRAKDQHRDGQLRQPNPLRLRVDWKAYWQEFKAVHGEPVLSGGRLIFRDGWSYSSTDIKGPEWHPPMDRHGNVDAEKLRTMQRRYWQLRHKILDREYLALTDIIRKWREMQALRSAAVKLTTVLMVEDENGNLKPKRMTVGMEAIDALEMGRVRDIEGALVECEEQLALLGTIDLETAELL